MYFPVSTFHEPIALSELFTESNKPSVAYGANWCEIVSDDERDIVALMAQVTSGDEIPQAFCFKQDGQDLVVFVCEGWPVNVVIQADERRFPMCDLHIIPCPDQKSAMAATIGIMEDSIKELIRESTTDAQIPRNVEVYIENNWPRHLQALLAQGEVSHVEAQIMDENLPEGYCGLMLKSA